MINILEACRKFGGKDVKSLHIYYLDYQINLYKKPNGLDIGDDDVVKSVRISEDEEGCVFLQLTYPKKKVEYYLNIAGINYCKLNYYV